MNKLVFNRACFFGSESINSLVDEIQNNHFKKAFVITDNGLIECGVAQKIISLLMKNKIPSVIFSDVTPEPTVNDVKNALRELKRSNADFILAIGGGSPIDTAKAISIIFTNPKYEDVSLAIKTSQLKETYTPCVLLRKGISYAILFQIANLPNNEWEKSAKLLLSLFKIAYRRRFLQETQTTHKWWYKDLSGNVDEIKKLIKD